MTTYTPVRRLDRWDARLRALRLWGVEADAWIGQGDNPLHFVIANRLPSKVTDLTVPFGVGLTFEAAFDDAERKFAL